MSSPALGQLEQPSDVNNSKTAKPFSVGFIPLEIVDDEIFKLSFFKNKNEPEKTVTSRIMSVRMDIFLLKDYVKNFLTIFFSTNLQRNLSQNNSDTFLKKIYF